MGTKPTGFGKGWLADAVHFDHHATPGHDRATIDQFTLPITATRQGRPVAGLDQAMNYNIQAFGDETDDPLWIAHYHNIGVLWAHGPTARHVVECLLDVISDDELAEYIDRFFIHIKRSRLKHVLRDVQAVLTPAPGTSFCEWKGAAQYWTVHVGGLQAVAAAWSYATPSPRFAALGDHVAFYAGKMGACYVGDERVMPQPGDFYGGWVTSNLEGRIKGGPGTRHW
jgi:hypothetical protein